MPKVRNISNDQRFIPVIGLTVDVDEAFEVSQEIFDSREWEIPDVFEVVTTTTTKKSVPADEVKE